MVENQVGLDRYLKSKRKILNRRLYLGTTPNYKIYVGIRKFEMLLIIGLIIYKSVLCLFGKRDSNLVRTVVPMHLTPKSICVL